MAEIAWIWRILLDYLGAQLQGGVQASTQYYIYEGMQHLHPLTPNPSSSNPLRPLTP